MIELLLTYSVHLNANNDQKKMINVSAQTEWILMQTDHMEKLVVLTEGMILFQHAPLVSRVRCQTFDILWGRVQLYLSCASCVICFFKQSSHIYMFVFMSYIYLYSFNSLKSWYGWYLSTNVYLLI